MYFLKTIVRLSHRCHSQACFTRSNLLGYFTVWHMPQVSAYLSTCLSWDVGTQPHAMARPRHVTTVSASNILRVKTGPPKRSPAPHGSLLFPIHHSPIQVKVILFPDLVLRSGRACPTYRQSGHSPNPLSPWQQCLGSDIHFYVLSHNVRDTSPHFQDYLPTRWLQFVTLTQLQYEL